MFDNVKNISSFSEKALIKRICSKFDNAMPKYPEGAGDDCAVLEKGGCAKYEYATSDAVIAGRHFLYESSPSAVAAKLIRRNVSDIASMGGVPKWALTSAIMSNNLKVDWLDEFCEALGKEASFFGIKLVGGDIASVDKNFFSMHMSLVGESDYEPMLRKNASLGDYIYTTGKLGLSFISEHHLNFTPRLAEGIALAKSSIVSACTDISDGLACDLLNILPKKSKAKIFTDKLPYRSFDGKIATLKEALCDGEDYELLFCSKKDDLEDVFNFECGLSLIGKIEPSDEKEIVLELENGELKNFSDSGFSHFLASVKGH